VPLPPLCSQKLTYINLTWNSGIFLPLAST
jgi:hypothetical protein